MTVQFNDGTVVPCTDPTEQKVFRAGEAAGWILSFTLSTDMTSDELDELITVENVSVLVFSDKSENEKILTLSGYDKIASAVIKHSEEISKAKIDIRLIKGV